MVERTRKDEHYIVQGLEGEFNKAARRFDICVENNNSETAIECLSDMERVYQDIIFYSKIKVYDQTSLEIVSRAIKEKRSELEVKE